MEKKGAQRSRVLELLEHHGGLKPGVAELISRETGVPAADVYGVATFYTLVSRPDAGVRVCQGLTCKMKGSDDLVADLEARGVKHEQVSCLGQCDRAPAAIDDDLLPISIAPPGALTPANADLPMNLAGEDSAEYAALAKLDEIGVEAVLAALDASGLQGRGGAGFPAAFKWRAVRNQPPGQRYVVVNADESEPGTFKDRMVMEHRPHLMLEGMAIAAKVAGADIAYIYVRGEYQEAKQAMERALAEAGETLSSWLDVRIVEGHGAYICGEETALLEALEGKRGMPRLKPPYPTEQGLFGKPTLMNNVETLACVPSIVLRSGEWFKAQGKTEAGSKLFSISGHVQNPGVYELPLGVTLDELVDAAGGYIGTPVAFSPGGASAGFLPMSFRDTPLDFKALQAVGSMMGSSGLVVINDTIPMTQAALWGLIFFEDESCGQCTPCRVGCKVQRQALERFIDGDKDALSHAGDVAWEMEEGSICGLGQVASWPLTTAMKHFPKDFGG
jgi:NADH:ubiquinone oxidoreductase subunit F (NADH-binding)